MAKLFKPSGWVDSNGGYEINRMPDGRWEWLWRDFAGYPKAWSVVAYETRAEALHAAADDWATFGAYADATSSRPHELTVRLRDAAERAEKKSSH